MYKKTYQDQNVSETENVFLNILDKESFEKYEIEELIGLITEKELKNAIETFKEYKVPRIDGLSIEFYKICFKIIKKEVLLVLLIILSSKIYSN